MSDKAVLNVTGMTCSSCAQGISKHLVKKGLNNVHVNFDSGEVEVDLIEGIEIGQVIKEINGLGYKASEKGLTEEKSRWLTLVTSLEFRFSICVIFTLPLLAHMWVSWHFLHLPYVQFILALPVMLIGLNHFGKSAWGSVKSGSPNMDVLITLGSTSAFIYSCAGWYLHRDSSMLADYLFFETSATIITLVLLGNIIEKSSLKKTQTSLEHLTRIQPQTARKIENAMTEKETTTEVSASSLHPNDLLLINAGDKVPADGLIYWGTATIDESMMTGESLPAEKIENDTVLSGTILLSGHIKVMVQQAGADTVLSNMIDTVRKSALRKPEIQRIGDIVSSWFVPVVVVISIITFLVTWLWMGIDTGHAMLRGIAVLVISCPCAMGLATPTAVAVGIGRAARNGILIKGADTLERLSHIDTIVFDKTGTLTTGKMTLHHIEYFGDRQLVDYLLGTLEQYSNHPFAGVLVSTFANAVAPTPLHFKEIKEVQGSGVLAIDKEGNTYKIGSAKYVQPKNQSEAHQVYVSKNDELLAAVDFEDPLRDDAKELIHYFKQNQIKTVLLSGDRKAICENIAAQLQIDQVFSEQMPIQKLEIIRELQRKGKVAMTGDGINDAPALAASSVGIAVGNGTQIALQTAEIILFNRQELKSIVIAHRLSGATFTTIKQNLFWALIYNVIAIPAAAAGLLSPMIASLSMAFSDVVVIGNSLRLHIKKLPGKK